ncbi:hypothetical protein SynA1544_01407 [Synechococcus sp. A15-44]|nr:hypothetical protein SynA1544_01407 [Synechococcus sp. A15-44]
MNFAFNQSLGCGIDPLAQIPYSRDVSPGLIREDGATTVEEILEL